MIAADRSPLRNSRLGNVSLVARSLCSVKLLPHSTSILALLFVLVGGQASARETVFGHRRLCGHLEGSTVLEHPFHCNDCETHVRGCDQYQPLGESPIHRRRWRCTRCFFGFGRPDTDFIAPRVWTLTRLCRPHHTKQICERDELLLGDWFYQPAWRVTGDIYSDFNHFYSPRGITLLSVGIGVHAVLANTSLDQDFQNSVQRNIGDPDALAIGRHLGNFGIVIPSVVSLWALGECLSQQPTCREQCIGRALNDWGAQTARALFVGATATGLLQVIIGASRPNEERGSRWRPFDDDNGVSGHALVGAVPFLVAASRTENRLLCGAFVVASGISAASRVYEDKHYLSQALLGWWIACLSVEATIATNYDRYQYRIVPISPSGHVGFAVELRR